MPIEKGCQCECFMHSDFNSEIVKEKHYFKVAIYSNSLSLIAVQPLSKIG